MSLLVRSLLARALMLAGLLTAWAAPTASASGIYWSANGAIGRANLDGTGANASFIPGVNAGEIAVDATSVYWTRNTGTIGRANLDGTAVNPNFISAIPGVSGVAADGSHVYWIRPGGESPTIGRANLDGTGIVETVVSGVGPDASDLAVDGSHLYWVNAGVSGVASANLDGTGVDEIVIVPGSCCYFNQITDIAVGDSGLYYAYVGVPVHYMFPPTGAIEGGRGSISGTDLSPRGVALDETFVYWTNLYPASGIWRANLDFSGATLLISGGYGDIAVSPEPVPEPSAILLLMAGLVGLAYRQRRHAMPQSA
ncbi:MAG TPA: PEP-CTERM sorting domain-containing protein [Myxococcota bacterium]|jgi:hypothetical protein